MNVGTEQEKKQEKEIPKRVTLSPIETCALSQLFGVPKGLLSILSVSGDGDQTGDSE